MSCDNVITVQDLETDKKHSTYYREVITGKAGGTGEDIDFATNAVTGQIQKTLTKAINELGVMGYARVGTFKVGATLTTARQTLLWDIADGGDGQEYGWSGTYPKVVPPSSTPNNTGGIGEAAWMSRFDPELKQQVFGRYAFSGKSLYDVLTEEELSRLLSDDTTLDLTPKIQSLIDEGKPFYLIPNVRHYCCGALQMRSGAKIIGAGNGTNQELTSTWTVDTAIVFNQSTTSTGIITSSQLGWVTEWAIDGVTLDTLDNSSGRSSFTMLKSLSGHSGCYGFKLNTHIRGAKLACDFQSPMWNVDTNIAISHCAKAITFPAGGTSWDGWVKVSFCFHGVDVTDLTYSNLSMWFDQCGLSAPDSVVASAPSNETPIMAKLGGAVGVKGVIGYERCNAQAMYLYGQSHVDFAVNYQAFGAAWVFKKDPARTGNLPLSKQGLFHIDDSTLNISSMMFNMRPSQGYPEADTVDPTYFATFSGFDIMLNVENSYIYASPYCVCPAGVEHIVNISNINNVECFFGAQNVNKLLPELALHKYEGLTLRYGVKDSKANSKIHRIYRDDVVYADGDIGLEIAAAEYAAPVKFGAANSPGYSASASALYVPKTTASSRSINAAGTINGSGADYAEYMLKRDDCGIIGKGDVCGIDANGLLTDRFSLSVKFAIKSTNPCIVGNDGWFTENAPVYPPMDSLSEDEFAEAVTRYDAEKAQHSVAMEEARLRVDRVAFCGQVPVNASFTAGEYLIPIEGDGDSIAIKSTKNPTFDEFRISVGHAISDSVVIVSI